MKNDRSLMELHDLALAMSLLTRVPVTVTDTSRNAQAAWAYPLAGLVPAGLAALVGLVTVWLGWSTALSSLMALGVLIVTTGAMHEDGLSDTADGLWGGWTREGRLDIMKDSRIGAYGIIALVLSLGIRWAALASLFGAGPGIAVPVMLAAALLSRAAMPIVMAALPHARDMGLSHAVGSVSVATAATGVALAAVLGLALVGWTLFPALLCAGLITWAMIALARHKIGGQTGDILGATQQMVEISVLLSLLP